MSEQAQTHGMDGSLVEADWPALCLNDVRAVLSTYGQAAEDVAIESVSPRPSSAASVVRAGGERVFIKRHHRSVRTAEGLEEEHAFMAHLRANGLAVPRVRSALDGYSAVEAGEWTYEVHDLPEGVDLYRDAISWTPFLSVEHARSAGAMLARVHLAAEGFAAPARRVQPLVASFSISAAQDAEAALRAYFDVRPALAASVETWRHAQAGFELLEPFHRALLPLLPALDPLWTHNDLHASNLFWSDESAHARAVAVIDFGLADRTNAVHDLAQAIERNMVEWLWLVQHPDRPQEMPVHVDHLAALLDGYESERPLSAEEAAALAPMTALCHAEFALTEADYFLGPLHSEEKARVASDSYLIGHARWFRSSAGLQLLDALHRWADVHQGAPR
jgi:Ser/Thr protein kinase RdoA (MazF antagonist)